MSIGGPSIYTTLSPQIPVTVTGGWNARVEVFALHPQEPWRYKGRPKLVTYLNPGAQNLTFAVPLAPTRYLISAVIVARRGGTVLPLEGTRTRKVVEISTSKIPIITPQGYTGTCTNILTIYSATHLEFLCIALRGTNLRHGANLLLWRDTNSNTFLDVGEPFVKGLGVWEPNPTPPKTPYLNFWFRVDHFNITTGAGPISLRYRYSNYITNLKKNVLTGTQTLP